jgi:proteasome accessory factor A
LENQGHAKRVTTDEQIEAAICNAPENTRAKARAHIMRYLLQNRLPCIVDWNQIYFTHEEPFEMKDPFDTYDAEVEALLKRLSQQPKSASRKKRVRF